MDNNGSGSGSRPRPSFWSGFRKGVPQGPQAYVDGRKSTIFETHDQSQPSGGLATLVSSVGVLPTVAFARSVHQGLLSTGEQQEVNHSLGQTAGSLTGSVATGVSVGLGLKMALKVVPPRAIPLVVLAQLGNLALTGATLSTAPVRFNSSLQQNSPSVHTALTSVLTGLNGQPDTVQTDVPSLTSMFEHSARQRESGTSSFRSAADVVRITGPF